MGGETGRAVPSMIAVHEAGHAVMASLLGISLTDVRVSFRGDGCLSIGLSILDVHREALRLALHPSGSPLLTFRGQVLPNPVSLAGPELSRRNPCRIQQFG